ncbi:MAG TPA: acyl-CoA dehydrogenase family protein [Chloroflexia bacterium]|nr:acyl-CoA dehydrogenase family protein [Chloroflexia bacterium]
MAGSETGKSLVDIAAELADLFGSRAEAHEKNGTFPYENYNDLRRSGYHLSSVPKEYGGWGCSIGEITRAQVRLGEGCGSTALVVAMHVAQTGRALLAGWPQETLDRFLTGIVEKGYLYNNAASEPATGSPSRGGVPTTTASPTSSGYTINGRKTWTTGSPVLHYISISAAMPGAEGEKPQVGNFLLTRDMPGITIEPTWNSLAMKLTASNDLVLNNVEVGPEAFLGGKAALTPSQAALNAAWTLPVAAVYFGIGRAAAKYAANFARNRRPNSLDKSIADLPHIQEKAGRMELALLSAENTLFHVADLTDSGEAERDPARLTALVGAAKYLATNKALEAIDIAMRIVGGASLSLDAPLQRYYRDSRAGLHNPPMDDASISMLGKMALGVL